MANGSLTAPKGATLSNPVKTYLTWAKRKQAENNARYRQQIAKINQRTAEARKARQSRPDKTLPPPGAEPSKGDRPPKRWPAVLVALVVVIGLSIGLATFCTGESGRWKDRGFESEAECWLHHGWDGSVSDGVDRHNRWDYWCG